MAIMWTTSVMAIHLDLRFDTSPLFLSNLLIKRVVSEGYSDTADEHYCQEALRTDYLDAGLISSVYAEEEVNED